MRKSIFATIVAAVLVSVVIVSCKKNGTSEQGSDLKTFYAYTSPKEKTAIASDMSTIWTAGDKIKVKAESGEAADFTLKPSSAGTGYGEFEGLITESGTYVAFYPSAESFSPTFDGTQVRFTLPDEQHLSSAGTFNANTVPLVAYTSDDNLYFYNIGSLLVFNIKTKSGKAKIAKIGVSRKSDQRVGTFLYGDFIVDASAERPIATEDLSANKMEKTLTVVCDNIEINSETPTPFYVFVPAGALPNGFTFGATNSNGEEDEIIFEGDYSCAVSEGRAIDVEVDLGEEPTFDVYDVCGNGYHTVEVGSQTWLVENMRCNKYDTDSERAGEVIAEVCDTTSGNYPFVLFPEKATVMLSERGWTSMPVEYGYYYEFVGAMGYPTYAAAKLQKTTYAEYAASMGMKTTRQGICPNGFRMPSKADFEELLAQNTLYNLKSNTGWLDGTYDSKEYHSNGDNATGFTLLPNGMAQMNEAMNMDGLAALFETCDAGGSSTDYVVLVNDELVEVDKYYKQMGKAVRCIKNN